MSIRGGVKPLISTKLMYVNENFAMPLGGLSQDLTLTLL